MILNGLLNYSSRIVVRLNNSSIDMKVS